MMELYGFRGGAGDFLKSYISSRSQFVSLNNAKNPPIYVVFLKDRSKGRFFLVYMILYIKFVLVADDTNIL